MAVQETRKGKEFQVIAQILRAAAKGSSVEEIMNMCRLDPLVLENYMYGLSQLSLVRVEGESLYRTTKKGLELLRIYHRLRWLLWGKENDFLLMRLLDKIAEKDERLFYVS